MPTLPEVLDHPHAPVIFFDEAPTFGHYNGVIAVTLSLNLSRPAGGEKIADVPTVAAYLRMNVQAAMALKDSLEKALVLAAPVPNEAKN